MIKIIVADDHTVMRKGISTLLEKVIDFEIIAEAASGQEVLDLLSNGSQPDLILADLNMPGIGGIDLCEQMKKKYSSVKLVLLTMLDQEKFIVRAFKSGANGYLLKSVTIEEMIFAISHVYLGGIYLSTELSARFLDRIIKTPVLETTSKEFFRYEFTGRDVEIIELIAEGFTNQEIADKLFTSKRTIEGQRQTLLEKTGTRNSAALTKFALINGFIH